MLAHLLLGEAVDCDLIKHERTALCRPIPHTMHVVLVPIHGKGRGEVVERGRRVTVVLAVLWVRMKRVETQTHA